MTEHMRDVIEQRFIVGLVEDNPCVKKPPKQELAAASATFHHGAGVGGCLAIILDGV